MADIVDRGEGEWLIDADNPLLTPEVMGRVSDPARPDRLVWNCFRTLALWETDAWIPPLLEVSCGPGTAVSTFEWGGTSVQPWASGLGPDSGADVVLDGPEGVVVLLATLDLDDAAGAVPSGVSAAARVGGGREAAFILIGPPSGDEVRARVGGAGETGPEPVTVGGLGWDELAALALDLAEEGGGLASEQVNRLVSEVQARFPGIQS